MGWDYSLTGYYFITICIKSHECAFGIIENNKITLNDYGIIANNCWLEIPKHFNVEIDEFIIMPNHIHGIIIIPPVDDAYYASSTDITNNDNYKPYDKTKMLIPKIIQQYKMIVTKKNNALNKKHFQWQKSYYDHIVRDETDLSRIREYIIYNPLKWNEDDENPKNYKNK